ncbi:hypothetical protein EVAR_90682_1 [Eumeta japonica]|uniref:Uncharacterized protein n=1 Tax=Eumeta variegata TaxID=151549 RepID=A0A4C1YZ88_EUMVA|nr:hypothetical protein EVAR_90682_1 [Eumeta japonica]
MHRSILKAFAGVAKNEHRARLGVRPLATAFAFVRDTRVRVECFIDFDHRPRGGFCLDPRYAVDVAGRVRNQSYEKRNLNPSLKIKSEKRVAVYQTALRLFRNACADDELIRHKKISLRSLSVQQVTITRVRPHAPAAPATDRRLVEGLQRLWAHARDYAITPNKAAPMTGAGRCERSHILPTLRLVALHSGRCAQS